MRRTFIAASELALIVLGLALLAFSCSQPNEIMEADTFFERAASSFFS